MTPAEQRGGHRPVTPFRPTQTPGHTPTTCWCCGRRAGGVGFGQFRSDPKFVCDLCLEIAALAKDFDLHELAAVERAGHRAGAYLDRLGKTDLAELTSAEWGYFLREVIDGFGDELRREIKNGVAL